MNRLSFTFKQFLEEQEIYAKKLGAVSEFTPALAEDNYRVGDITFSAKDGLGSVPFNQSVYYHGFVVLMKPSMFLGLVLDDQGQQDTTAAKLVELVKDGYALGIPFISVSTQPFEEDGQAPKITGHEGRGRMKAVKSINGDNPIPVHVFLSGGMRARDLTPDLIAALKGRLQAEQSKRVVNSPFESMFVNGKAV